MKQRIAIAVLLVGLAVVLGATVFRDQVAWAAQSVDAHITNIDGNGNIKVHEQGTAAVNVTNTTVPVHEQGTPTVAISPTSNTVEPDQHLNTPFVVYRALDVTSFSGGNATTTFTVPAGKVFVLQHVSVTAVARNGDSVGLTGTFRLPDNTPPDGRNNADYGFNLVKGNSDATSTVWGYSQNDTIAIYAGENQIFFGASGESHATVVFSGYLASFAS